MITNIQIRCPFTYLVEKKEGKAGDFATWCRVQIPPRPPQMEPRHFAEIALRVSNGKHIGYVWRLWRLFVLSIFNYFREFSGFCHGEPCLLRQRSYSIEAFLNKINHHGSKLLGVTSSHLLYGANARTIVESCANALPPRIQARSDIFTSSRMVSATEAQRSTKRR